MNTATALQKDPSLIFSYIRKGIEVPSNLTEVPSTDVTTEVPKTRKVKSGYKSEVYAFEIEDLKKMMEYFYQHEMWLQYLLFVLSCNLARRCGDMLTLQWKNFFDPKTGNFRKDILEIREDKTDKLANPRINQACRDAINLYIEKMHCDVTKENYTIPVFIQLSGTHRGRVITEDGYLKSLKKAASEVGIEYNVGTHSTRKTFGMLSRMLHPGDYDSMELLQSIYNHASTATTKHYIGLTKKKIDQYYDDFGTFFGDYITGDKEYKQVAEKPIVSLDTNDLRDIVRAAYEAGKNNANNLDAMVHIDAINSVMEMVETMQK